MEKSTGKKFAAKTIWKAQHQDKKNYIKQEIEICLKTNDNEFIIKCYDVFEDINCIHFIFELVEGGDLFDYLISCPNHQIPESRAQEFFYQILDALQYLHDQHIVHRDIKPENFLICHEGSKIKLKLIDFGFATILPEGEKLNDAVGSLQYVAPEMINQNPSYDLKVDMWAAGVVLYNMITGKQPFFSKLEQDFMELVLNHEPFYDPNLFKNMHCRTLCMGLLTKNPGERFSAAQAKMSIWIQSYMSKDLEPTRVDVRFNPNAENIKNIMDLLNQQSNVKTEIWNLLLEHLSNQTIEDLSFLLDQKYNKQIDDGSIQGKSTISYFVFLNEIINYGKGVNEQLSNSLKSTY
jgi:calcium-dependent protein kinase